MHRNLTQHHWAFDQRQQTCFERRNRYNRIAAQEDGTANVRTSRMNYGMQYEFWKYVDRKKNQQVWGKLYAIDQPKDNVFFRSVLINFN